MTTPAPKTPPSPTPWKLDAKPPPGGRYRRVLDADGFEIAIEVPAADAERIVLAVNEYEGLREALRDFTRVPVFKCPWGCADPDKHGDKCNIAKARAILARIEEQTR